MVGVLLWLMLKLCWGELIIVEQEPNKGQRGLTIRLSNEIKLWMLVTDKQWCTIINFDNVWYTRSLPSSLHWVHYLPESTQYTLAAHIFIFYQLELNIRSTTSPSVELVNINTFKPQLQDATINIILFYFFKFPTKFKHYWWVWSLFHMCKHIVSFFIMIIVLYSPWNLVCHSKYNYYHII